MNVSNPTDFYYLIKHTQLQDNPQLKEFLNCMDNYNSICNCKANEKSNKYKICVELYKRHGVNVIPAFKDFIFNQIKDKDLILTHDGSPLITLLK